MMAVRVEAIDRSDVPPLFLSDRFRTEVCYFIGPPDAPEAPKQGPSEYWIRQQDARAWLEDGVLEVVSPLDAENKAQVELSEDHEACLEWLVEHGVERVRLV